MKRALGRLASFTRQQTQSREKNIALSELGPDETRLRRQRAHDVASVLGSLHSDGLDVDPRALAIAQRYVDGEIPVDTMTAAIMALSTSGSPRRS
jgi:hypothetical protein